MNNSSNTQNESNKKKRKADTKMWKFVSWTPEEHYSEDPEQKIKMMQTSEGSSFVTMKIKLKHADKKRKTAQEETNVSDANMSAHQESLDSTEILHETPIQPHPFLVTQAPPNYVLTTTNLEHIQRRDVPSLSSLFEVNSSIHYDTPAQSVTIEHAELDLLLAQLLAQQPKPPPL